jgi:hypothetical protein
MKEIIVEMCFSDWETVQKWLTKHGVLIEEKHGTTICKSPNHPIPVGFDWASLDYFTRAIQLQFIFFGGRYFLEGIDKLISEKYKSSKKR